MAIQNKILTRQETAKVKKVVVSEGTASTVEADLASEVGALALGKLGDVIVTAYGPVAKAYQVAEETGFGALVTETSGEGEQATTKTIGILVNSDDCAGIGNAVTPFDTKTLKKGQVGTVLISGGAVVLAKDLADIEAAMNVVDVIGAEATDEDDETAVVGVIVNGVK